MSKELIPVHTQRMGLCRLEDGSVALYAETEDAIYYLPMQKAAVPYVAELEWYLILKYGEEVAEAFLDFGLDEPLENYFDEDGQLDRHMVVADVDTWLDSQAAGS